MIFFFLTFFFPSNFPPLSPSYTLMSPCLKSSIWLQTAVTLPDGPCLWFRFWDGREVEQYSGKQNKNQQCWKAKFSCLVPLWLPDVSSVTRAREGYSLSTRYVGSSIWSAEGKWWNNKCSWRPKLIQLGLFSRLPWYVEARMWKLHY